MIRKYFQIANFIDKVRWERDKSNQGFDNDLGINFYQKNLSNEVMLLTHWFCYITNRRMDYKRIWYIGGYVFSEMADKINFTNFNLLLNPNKNQSFVVVDDKNKNLKYTFKSFSLLNEDNLLVKNYNFPINGNVLFKSMYLPSDFKSIIYTYMLLESLDYTFGFYLKQSYEKSISDNSINLARVAFFYYLLSFYDIGQPDSKDIMDFSNFIKECKKRTKKVRHILMDNELFEDEFEIFVENKIKGKKRIWCILRDHLKWPELNDIFLDILKNNGFSQFSLINTIDTISQLELPGDVWNNKPIFWKCLLEDTKYSKYLESENFSIILREIYKKEKIKIGYPEQFDFTFSFINRMCEENNCDICLFNELLSKKTNFKKLCVNNHDKYCPVLMTYCGYLTNCQENCELLNVLKD